MKYALWLLALVGAILVALKLLKVVAWSWWWVVSPLLAATAIFVVGVVIALVVLRWIGELHL